MPSRFLWILLLLPTPLMAAWSGIAAFVGQNESEWLHHSTLSQANINFFGLRIEDKTQAELRVGASAGRFELRLLNLIDETAEKYYGQFLSLYLRWPIELTDQVKFNTRLSYQLNRGENSVELNDAEINWSEVSISAGLSFKLGELAVRPFINFQAIDGDTSSAIETRIFKQSESSSYGLMLDFFTDRTAFIRLMASTGSNRALLLSFAREI